MRFTESQHGLKRATFIIEKRLSTEDIAMYLIYRWKIDNYNVFQQKKNETIEQKEIRINNFIARKYNGTYHSNLKNILLNMIENYSLNDIPYKIMAEDLENSVLFLKNILDKKYKI